MKKHLNFLSPVSGIFGSNHRTAANDLKNPVSYPLVEPLTEGTRGNAQCLRATAGLFF